MRSLALTPAPHVAPRPRRRALLAALFSSLVIFGSTDARAVVFTDKSPPQKLRADVARQVATYTRCLVNALLSCERTGALATPECTLETGATIPPADPRGRFPIAVARCAARLDYDRKGPKGNTSVENYELVGCPTGTGGPRLADMNEFEQSALAARGVLDDLTPSLPAISGCNDTKSCVKAGRVLARFAEAFGKCQTACENDYKDKKGNGGIDDNTGRCQGTGAPDAAACIVRARERFAKQSEGWPLAGAIAPILEGVVDEQTDALFNIAPNCF